MPSGKLEEFIEDVTGESHLRVEEDLGGGFVRLRTSEADRRQAQQDIRCVEDIVLELLRNARDAGSRMICVATNREGSTRNIVVLDDGEGIPPEMQDRVFEPRVTSRLETFHADQWGVHGRGMALFSIASNTETHRIAQSGIGLGTAVQVSADVARLSEKTDQSTIPRFVVEESGRKVVRGPRNINRIVTEFTLAQKGTCLVYLGSPNEVLATLVEHGKRVLSAVEVAFAADYREYPICLRPALAASPEELAEIAVTLGLDTSSRSARRILDGEVQALEPFVNKLDIREGATKHMVRRGRTARPRPVAISAEDTKGFSDKMQDAFADIAESYYLQADVEPQIRVTREGMRIFIPFVDKVVEEPGK